MQREHNPVLLNEVLQTLNVQNDGIYIDATFGAGGYSNAILKSANCVLYGIDKDASAFYYVKNIDVNLQKNFHFIHGDFANVAELLNNRQVFLINGIVFDVGVSSMQLDYAERGFSFMRDGMLDMRMNQEQDFSAIDVVNSYSQSHLEDLIFRYGDERAARKIAGAIVAARKVNKIDSTLQLADIVSCAIGKRFGAIHPATKTFQAIRIEVNDELNNLVEGMEGAVKLLGIGGVMCVVTFHSLEDEIVKSYFSKLCGKKQKVNKYRDNDINLKTKYEFINIYKKPLCPSRFEVKANPRARSAKLRAIIRG